MNITASIVTFHTKHSDLKRLIDCTLQSPISCLYVIDNSSNDELREFVKYNPKIKYIHSLNLGYGAGHNIAIRKAIDSHAKYHIILNPDIYWDGQVIEKLTEYMESSPNCGLIMPKVLYPNGDTQYLCKLLPTPIDLIIRRFVPLNNWKIKHDYYYELQATGYNKIMEVPVLSGCFMMLRIDIIKEIGGFDERFFMYAEDIDLCRRIGEKSQTIFYPNVSIFHEYAKASYKNYRMLKLHVSSIIKYFNKWGWLFDFKRGKKNKECLQKLDIY